MEAANAKPLETVSGGGVQKKSDTDKVEKLKGFHQVKKEEKEEESSGSSMKLIIGIGATGYIDNDDDHDHDGPVIIKHEKNPLLTAAQLNELKLQVLIYKYIAAGLPLPSALVLSIRKSLVFSFQSLGFGNGELHTLYPSFVGCSLQEIDSRNLMVPDSERCRRTDGKKWRCKKNVVTGQKYCDRHMHRGRLRSRKPVEVEPSQMVTTPLNNSTNKPLVISNTSISTLPNSISNPSTRTCDLDTKIKGTRKTLPESVVSGLESISTSMTGSGVNATASIINGTVHSDSVKLTLGTNNSNGSNNHHRTISIGRNKNGNCGKISNLKNLIDRDSNHGRTITDARSQGLNSSPNSVLQVQGCSSACFCRSNAELELGRCRRTDGKKWRCRRDVVPNEKYCKMHMHRGAKKRMEASPLPACLNATPNFTNSTHQQPSAILPNKEDSTNLNTNLDISISANCQIASNDDTSDTTISDAIVASCEDVDFSS